MQSLNPVSILQVQLADPFLSRRQLTNHSVTIPHIEAQMRAAGRFAAIEPGSTPAIPHWQADVVEWIEAASYDLLLHPNPRVENLIDALADSLAGCLLKDGYLEQTPGSDSPETRWRDMRDNHRLYALGHFMEAAVAWFEVSGKRNLLDLAEAVSHHIAKVFGKGPGQIPGYCGHPLIEMALIRLYHCTGDQRHLDLATYFINERGQSPNFFENEPGSHFYDTGFFRDVAKPWVPSFNQSHLPVREQTTAEGHAVRAVYLYCAMADMARVTKDESLLKACRTIWDNLTTRKMYITGGIGSSFRNEGFGGDYELPNVGSYCESCASVSMVFWGHRMTHTDLDPDGRPDGRYADVMERALYNGVSAGVSLEGNKFLYWNKLHATNHNLNYQWHDHRQSWFPCACCPPNIARLYASLNGYAYSQSENKAAIHLYAAGSASLSIANTPVKLQIASNYPWAGEIKIEVNPKSEAAFGLLLRIPGWCKKWNVQVNGESANSEPKRGYVEIDRLWATGDIVTLNLEMPVERVHAHPSVREDRGRVALQRGPLVYCFEEADNKLNPDNLAVSAHAKAELVPLPELGPESLAIRVEGTLTPSSGWDSQLYRSSVPPVEKRTLVAVPYCLWDNRSTGEMLVWIREGL